MSKGGAGKVYFVLYLAVILELLIIIVERDEAEEHLIAKQRESMRIVESILSQLQVGAGSEGINTRPQDQITIPPPGVNVKEAIGADIKPERKYLVEVGITDVTSALKMTEKEEPEEYVDRVKRFLKLSNVSDLKYEILYSNSQSDEEVPQDSSMWSTKVVMDLALNYPEMEKRVDDLWSQNRTNPQAFIQGMLLGLKEVSYNVPATSPFKPGRVSEPEFYYSKDETNKLGEDVSKKKRSFVVNFEPKEAGWYKLRFSSHTNKILGVSIKEGGNNDIDPEEKVNIGTVQLKVKDLLKVKDELIKHTDGLPTLELARTNLDAFDAKLDELANGSDDINVKSRVRLYGAIIKLTTRGIKTENAFKQNQGQIEFNIRVLKPAPQITDPKIADLKTVVRVFDKLASIKLPMSVTPANGTTAFLKNPNNAGQVQGSGATASGGSGAGSKWVNKELVIPVAGTLTPRDEPYVFELQQKNASKLSEVVQCSVYVYPSRLINAEEVKSALEASWGDALELVAQPASGNTIKPDEFVMNFNMGAGTQTPPVRKLAVGQADNIKVPPGADNVQLTISWKDPQSGDVVELYNGSGDVGLKKPLVLTQDIKVDPIMNNSDPEFKVRGIMVKPPQISDTERAEVGDVEVQVSNSNVRDLKSNTTYKVAVVGKARKISGNEYEVTLKLAGGKLPLTKGQVKGNISLSISATARSQGATSKPRVKSQPIQVSN
ncbi:MAG: hypothetical protein NTX15_08245 [Candidatus Kapabacteria bacterium]|nr:hypothetical protein [Candidatus Kapabacteria bacterium]